MKKLISLLLSALLFALCLSGCAVTKTNTSDYAFMYNEMLNLSNFYNEPDFDDLFGYGQYCYNSHLILFPREAPSTLTDYYFYWGCGIDVDNFNIFFTCTLTAENYEAFRSGLKGFTIKNGEKTYKPLYDDTHFSLPTYVLQWANAEEKWEALEYIMLDDATRTAVFVYAMGPGDSLKSIEKQTGYIITPTDMHFLEDFSIYGEYGPGDSYIYPDNFEDAVYDISFLEYLK